jgi:hypothetical protein
VDLIVVCVSTVVCGIAAKSIGGYNDQPRKSDTQVFNAECAFIWIGIQEDGQLPIFFLVNRF